MGIVISGMKIKMKITLVWDDARSFKRHVADMKQFRLQHKDTPANELNIFKDMPRPGNLQPANPYGGSKISISTKRKSNLVPIWEIELPGGVQN